jgi:hypothetical protein
MQDRHQLVRIVIRKRSQNDCVDDRKDGGVCSNAETKRQHRHARKEAVLVHHS